MPDLIVLFLQSCLLCAQDMQLPLELAADIVLCGLRFLDNVFYCVNHCVKFVT